MRSTRTLRDLAVVNDRQIASPRNWRRSQHSARLPGVTLRLRLRELLKERDMSPYAFSKATRGRVSMSTAYRVVRMRGRLAMFDAKLLDAICDVLQVEPGELFERKRKRRRSKH